MSRQAWKWIFELMSDDDLVSLAHSARVKVPGFRHINVEQIKILRPRLVQTMSTGKDLARVKHTIEDHTKTCEQCASFRTKTQAELIQDIEQGSNPIKVLTSLLASSESGQQLLGELLFENLHDSGRLTEITTRMSEVRKHIEVRETLQNNLLKQNEEQMKLLKKYEEKITKLEKSQTTITEYQSELEQKIKQLHANMEEQLEQMEEERLKWQEERTDLLRQLADKQALLDQKVLAVAASVEVAADAENHVQVVSADLGGKTPVALVGKTLTVEAQQYAIKMVLVNQVEQAFEQNLFQSVDQVWVLTYEAPLGTQRKLRRQISRERLREFHTLKELQRHIGI